MRRTLMESLLQEKPLVQDLRMHNMDSNEGFGRMDLEGITIVVWLAWKA